MKPASTGKKQGGDTRFKPGQSGNPNGRKPGSKQKLGEDFIAALAADFEQHGAAVVQTVRVDKPDQYLKVIASILPKEVEIKRATLDGLTDDELAAGLEALRALVAGGTGAGRTAPPSAGEPSPVH